METRFKNNSLWVKVYNSKPSDEKSDFSDILPTCFFEQIRNLYEEELVQIIQKLFFRHFVRNLPAFGKKWFIDQVDNLYGYSYGGYWLTKNHFLVKKLIFNYRQSKKKSFSELSKKIGSLEAEKKIYSKPKYISIDSQDFVESFLRY